MSMTSTRSPMIPAWVAQENAQVAQHEHRLARRSTIRHGRRRRQGDLRPRSNTYPIDAYTGNFEDARRSRRPGLGFQLRASGTRPIQEPASVTTSTAGSIAAACEALLLAGLARGRRAQAIPGRRDPTASDIITSGTICDRLSIRRPWYSAPAPNLAGDRLFDAGGCGDGLVRTISAVPGGIAASDLDPLGQSRHRQRHMAAAAVHQPAHQHHGGDAGRGPRLQHLRRQQRHYDAARATSTSGGAGHRRAAACTMLRIPQGRRISSTRCKQAISARYLPMHVDVANDPATSLQWGAGQRARCWCRGRTPGRLMASAALRAPRLALVGKVGAAPDR